MNQELCNPVEKLLLNTSKILEIGPITSLIYYWLQGAWQKSPGVS